MNIGHSSKQPLFRDSYTWKSVPYNQNKLVTSSYFNLSCNIEVKCRLSAYRFQNPSVTVLHVLVEKECTWRPHSAANITITLSDGRSKIEEIGDWFKDSSVFCFSNKADDDQWRPDIKCDIDWYGFISEEEKKNFLNKKKDLRLDQLLSSAVGSDVNFIVKGQVLSAHRCILEHYSPIFCATFKEAGSAYKKITLNLHNFDFDTIKEVLNFMYTGKFVIDDFYTWASTLRVAQAYKINKLEKYCIARVERFIESGNLSPTLMINS